MANSNGMITAPVSIPNDIAPVLGVGSFSLGYLASNRHGKINKYARCKPLDYAQERELTEADRIAKNYGLIFNTYSTLGDLMNALVAGDKYDWTYVPPTTTYRTLDFNGYSHNAEFPILETPQNTYIIISGQIYVIYLDASDADNIDLTKMNGNGTPLSSFYFGVYVRPTYNTSMPSKVATSNVRLVEPTSQEDPYTVYLNGFTTANAEYKMYTFLSSIKLTGNEDTSARGIFIPLPYAGKDVKVKNGYLEVSFEIDYFNDAGTAVDYKFHIYNEGPIERYTGLITLRLKKGRTVDSATVTDTATFPDRKMTIGQHEAIEGSFAETYEPGWSYFLEVMSTAIGTYWTIVGEP